MATTEDRQPTPPTLVVFLLDRTGSMDKIKSETIEAFNDYLTGLQEPLDGSDPDNILFTFLQFDSASLDQVCVAIPIKEVPLLTTETFVPRAFTPLIEAATDTITMTEKVVASRKDKPKVVICFQTDGEENASGEGYTWTRLKTKIEQKQKLGWQFNFLGAGLDAYTQARQMGIAAAQTMSYDHVNLTASKMAFAASASNTRRFASGLAETTQYSMSQREASGDQHADKWLHQDGTDKAVGDDPSQTTDDATVVKTIRGIRRK